MLREKLYDLPPPVGAATTVDGREIYIDHILPATIGLEPAGGWGGGGVCAKCEVMGFCLKNGHIEKGGGVRLLRVRFATFRVSDHRFMGCSDPQYGHFESFRVLEHRLMGCPIPQCSRFESFCVFTGCPTPELRLCQQQVHRVPRYGCGLLCVSCQCTALLDACPSHLKKFPWWIDPSTTFTSISISSRHSLHCVCPKPPT